MPILTRTFISLIVAALPLGFAFADDSAITWSGAPTMLKGHASISMVSEKIVLNVVQKGYDSYTDADCTFVFHNRGPACSVRIGFPDRARGADAGNYMRNGGGDFPHPTHHMLSNFKSWVNGTPAKTSVVLGQDPSLPGATYGGSWHVKVVKFKRNQTLTIRDTYRQPQSGGVSAGPYLNQVQYIMSTGASWRGTIGSAEVDVHMKRIKEAHPLSDLTKGNPYQYENWGKAGQDAVYYLGFSKPEVRPGELIFRAKNLKPGVASDINLFWPNPPFPTSG